MTDHDMSTALAEAQRGETMFGAVLVGDGAIVARAHNTVSGTHNPSAHAELGLIQACCQDRRVTSPAGYTLYTPAEPCLMCAATSFTGSKVVFGVSIAKLSGLGVPQLETCAEVVRRGPSAVRGAVPSYVFRNSLRLQARF